METFNKKNREKERAKRKKMKLEKRELKKEKGSKGLEIDWSSAPENLTLTEKEKQKKDANQAGTGK